jgi:hypothetical protein
VPAPNKPAQAKAVPEQKSGKTPAPASQTPTAKPAPTSAPRPAPAKPGIDTGINTGTDKQKASSALKQVETRHKAPQQASVARTPEKPRQPAPAAAKPKPAPSNKPLKQVETRHTGTQNLGDK